MQNYYNCQAHITSLCITHSAGSQAGVTLPKYRVSILSKIISHNFLQITPCVIHTANLVGSLFIESFFYFFNFDDVINKNTVYFCLRLLTAASRSQSPRFPTLRRSARTQEARMRQRRRLS